MITWPKPVKITIAFGATSPGTDEGTAQIRDASVRAVSHDPLAGFAQARQLGLYAVALGPKAAEIRERCDRIGIVGRLARSADGSRC